MRLSFARALSPEETKAIRTSASSLSKAPGAILRRARRLLPGPRPAILMYHRIAEETFDPWGLAVKPAHFKEQLSWLAENRMVLPLGEFAARHCDKTLPRTAIALTFDDGYMCTADVAAQLLNRANLPATIFISAELTERGRPFWWDELQDIALSPDRDSLEIAGERIALGAKHQDDRVWNPGAPPRTARQRAFHRIWASLREKPPGELDDTMASLRKQSAVAPDRPVIRPMTPEKVRATVSDGIEFGSHALSHPWLTSLDRSTKLHEICDSVDRCAKLTGSRPRSFAYPYGNFDDESEQLVQEAGFACACASNGGSVRRRSRLFALPRIQVEDGGAAALARRLLAS
jgi:peptidoglycan/xylan/chitin deacetylase (PgdA/CDA1 family)